MYSLIEPTTIDFAMKFCTEAEALWRTERTHNRDSFTAMAAAEFLCLGYLGQGRNHVILTYVSEVSSMGGRLGLFSIRGEDVATEASRPTESADFTRARDYASWGAFNWLT